MSFDIVCQYNTSEANKLNKSLTDIVTKSGTLKSETSIIDPVFIIAGDLSELATVNYLTISEFNRRYFVRDIKSIRTGLVELTAHCDVLSSFQAQLLNNSAIIAKQEYKYNLLVDDGTFRVYQNPIIQTISFPSGFNHQSYLLAVAGG